MVKIFDQWNCWNSIISLLLTCWRILRQFGLYYDTLVLLILKTLETETQQRTYLLIKIKRIKRDTEKSSLVCPLRFLQALVILSQCYHLSYTYL